MKKKISGVFLIIFALIICNLPIPEVMASGVSNDFMVDGKKLIKYVGTATVVSIPDSIEVIGAEAFADLSELSGISISNKVHTIENGAFSNCTQLRRISIPDTVIKIGASAFSNCVNLNTVIMGKGVTSIGEGAFVGCDSLETIKIAEDNPAIICEKGVLYNKDKSVLIEVLPGKKETQLVIPASVRQISPYAFYGCKNLTTVSLPSNLSEIAEYAFSNCSGLLEISLPYSVKSIQIKAFENCISLKKIAIPSTVKYIHNTAFDGCNNLQIDAAEGSVADIYAKEILANIDTEFDSTVEQLQTDREETLTEENITVEDSANENQNSSGETEITTENEPSNLLGKTIIVGNNAVLLYDSTSAVYSGNSISGVNQVMDLGDNEQYTINPDVQNRFAYYRRSDLAQYEFPTGINRVEDFCFARSSLQKIKMPDTVTSVGYAAFYHCNELKEIELSKNITDIEAKAFEFTPWLQDFYDNSSEEYLIVGDGVLLAYKGNQEEISIPDGVKYIAAEAFNNHYEIKRVNFPNSLIRIKKHAFLNCTKLEEIEGGQQLETVEEDAFLGCPVTLEKMEVTSAKNLTNGTNYPLYQLTKQTEGIIVTENSVKFVGVILLIIGITLLFGRSNKRKLMA